MKPSLRYLRWPLMALVVLALMGFHHWASARDSHVVTEVYDGDTIRLDDGRKVRLTGVDAPEVDSPYSKEEPGGSGSRQYLTNLVRGKRVVVKVGGEAKDRYGRTLAMVYLGDVLVNGRIIRDGWAGAYVRFEHPNRELFMMYEKEARARGIGMWHHGEKRRRGWHGEERRRGR
jgi:micrococcal nuclease